LPGPIFLRFARELRAGSFGSSPPLFLLSSRGPTRARFGGGGTFGRGGRRAAPGRRLEFRPPRGSRKGVNRRCFRPGAQFGKPTGNGPTAGPKTPGGRSARGGRLQRMGGTAGSGCFAHKRPVPNTRGSFPKTGRAGQICPCPPALGICRGEQKSKEIFGRDAGEKLTHRDPAASARRHNPIGGQTHGGGANGVRRLFAARFPRPWVGCWTVRPKRKFHGRWGKLPELRALPRQGTADGRPSALGRAGFLPAGRFL